MSTFKQGIWDHNIGNHSHLYSAANGLWGLGFDVEGFGWISLFGRGGLRRWSSHGRRVQWAIVRQFPLSGGCSDQLALRSTAQQRKGRPQHVGEKSTTSASELAANVTFCTKQGRVWWPPSWLRPFGREIKTNLRSFEARLGRGSQSCSPGSQLSRQKPTGLQLVKLPHSPLIWGFAKHGPVLCHNTKDL